uniref:Zinc finger PHD-type domain-containing protein n=1 Tax=Caenorhabditis japonica TaxID=281687 RepID=A0A8R1HM81_CAEJA
MDVIRYLRKRAVIKQNMTSFEGFKFFQSLNLSRGHFSLTKSLFREFGISDPTPSRSQIESIEGLYGDDDYFEVITVTSTDFNGNSREVTVSRLKNVQSYVQLRIQELAYRGKLLFDEESGPRIWLTIFGDKGGDEFKLAVSIANVETPNSAHHLVPLGIFNDDENAENLTKYLGPIIDELNAMSEVEIELANGSSKIPIVQFLGGDMKFQYEVLGHEGGGSLRSCSYCYKQGKSLIEEYERGVGCVKRSEASYEQDAHSESKKNRNNVKPNSTFLFKRVTLDRVVPASLHIMMGVVQKYGICYCLNSTRQTDNDSGLPILNTDLKTERAAKARLLEAENELNTVETDLLALKNIQQVLERFEERAVIDSGFEDICEAKYCLFKDKQFLKQKRYDSRFEKCGECYEQYHAVCMGLWDTFSWELAGNVGEVLRCHRCAGKTGQKVLKMAVKKRECLEKELTVAVRKRSELECNYECLMDVVKGKGATRKRLEACWKKQGADMILEQTPDIPYVKGFLESFGHYQQLCVARTLTDEERTRMDDAIKSIWKNLLMYAGKETVTPKLHILLEHVMEFVWQHGTIGKMSEQGIESLHKHINFLKVRFRSIPKAPKRWRLIFKALLQRNHISDVS